MTGEAKHGGAEILLVPHQVNEVHDLKIKNKIIKLIGFCVYLLQHFNYLYNVTIADVQP